MTKPRVLRCAIYTRKSTEEGLEQSFNSLHAQREACEAYVRSQAGEGWKASKTIYDDGGFSGGSMDRPALKALLKDIEAGEVDIVVVYKVDRLTRSLMDFAKIVETFDNKGVSFLSVTQAFNTTSSMGRLTLNILLSFAQFEREVTSERIRDKIAASKAKGMWMGARPPLGYDAKDKQLVVNHDEAATVRRIFELFLDLTSASQLVARLCNESVLSKRWVDKQGAVQGGKPFTYGALIHLLKSPIYVGKIPHKDVVHPGLHEGIIDDELFQRVQGLLEETKRALHKRQGESIAASPLKGKIFDERGEAMIASFSYGKQRRSYRYYIAKSGSTEQGAVGRISAPQIEAVVEERLRMLFGESAVGGLHAKLERVEARSHSVHLVIDGAELLKGYANSKAALLELEGRLDPKDHLSLEPETRLRIVIDVRPVFRGGRTWLVNPDGGRVERTQRVDQNLVGGLRRAHRCLADHNATPSAPLTVLHKATSPDDSYHRKLAVLAFLAPDIQQAIMDGRQPAGLTLQSLLKLNLPLDWDAQRQQLGFSRL